MTFSAAGTFVTGSGSPVTARTLSPTHIGDLWIIAFMFESNMTGSVSAISSPRFGTWTKIGRVTNASATAAIELWYAVSTSTGTSATTFTWSGTTGQVEVGCQGFTGATTWALDTSNNNSGTSTTCPFASITPAHADELYVGAMLYGSSPTAGSTTGYTYKTTTDGDFLVYNPDCTTSAQAPASTQASSFVFFSLVAMFYDSAAGGTNAAPTTTAFSGTKTLGTATVTTTSNAAPTTTAVSKTKTMGTASVATTGNAATTTTAISKTKTMGTASVVAAAGRVDAAVSPTHYSNGAGINIPSITTAAFNAPHPSAFHGTKGLVAPTVTTSGGASVTTTAISKTKTLGSANVTIGLFVKVTTTAISRTETMGTATVNGRSNVTPAPVARTATIGSAGVAASSRASVAPTAVTGAATLGTAHVNASSITGANVSPTAVAAHATVGTPALSIRFKVTAVTATGVVRSVTITARTDATPGHGAGLALVGSPHVTTANTARVVVTAVTGHALVGSAHVHPSLAREPVAPLVAKLAGNGLLRAKATTKGELMATAVTDSQLVATLGGS